MNRMKAAFLLQILAWFLSLCDGGAINNCYKASTWDKCRCSWNAWRAWSDCDSDCYGSRVRTRPVQTICDEFTDCASGGCSRDFQDCNQVCHNGGTPTSYRCNCRAGYTGRCCSNRISCGTPDRIANGHLTYMNTFYADTCSYSCNHNYNMTGGSTVRKCGLNAAWDGVKPYCAFVNHCASGPCQNGATCTDLLDDYSCTCKDGWSGQHCEQDIQPPVVSDCWSDFRVNATTTSHHVEWVAPDFTDPMGNQLTVAANYPSPAFTFPKWGDFMVQYVATKPSNGLQTACQFNVGVRPTPCKQLNIPANGARVCNGFRSDYGQYCLVACQSGYTIDPTVAQYETMYVCGASGNWLASGPLPDCSIERDPVDIVADQPIYPAYSYSTSSCSDPVTMAGLQSLFIDVISAADSFSEICADNPNDCLAENVIVDC